MLGRVLRSGEERVKRYRIAVRSMSVVKRVVVPESPRDMEIGSGQVIISPKSVWFGSKFCMKAALRKYHQVFVAKLTNDGTHTHN